jgi:hypothetical protein
MLIKKNSHGYETITKWGLPAFKLAAYAGPSW